MERTRVVMALAEASSAQSSHVTPEIKIRCINIPENKSIFLLSNPVQQMMQYKKYRQAATK